MNLERSRRSAGAIALLLVLVACSVAPAEPAAVGSSPTSAVIRSVPVAPIATSQCIQITATDESPNTTSALFGVATDVLVGTFVAYGPTIWNTPDGHRPTLEEVGATSALLVRPLVLASTERILGSTDPSRLIQVGGSAGCDRIDLGKPDLKAARYVFFLIEVNDSQAKPSGNAALITAWPVTDSGLVSTPSEGELSIHEVQERMSDGPQKGPPIEEPTSGPPG